MSTANENRDAIIERLRKLYAMSQDVSSPEEAAIAGRRARALMDKHGVTIDDLQTSEFGETISEFTKRRLPAWVDVLAVGVALMNDVRVARVGHRIRFQGFDLDTQSAQLMLDYLVQTCNRHCKRWQADEMDHYYGSARRQATQFRDHYSSEMQRRLREMRDIREKDQREAAGTGTSLVVLKKQLVEQKFGQQRLKRAGWSSESVAGAAGREAARRTGLDSQVNTSASRHARLGG